MNRLLLVSLGWLAVGCAESPQNAQSAEDIRPDDSMHERPAPTAAPTAYPTSVETPMTAEPVAGTSITGPITWTITVSYPDHEIKEFEVTGSLQDIPMRSRLWRCQLQAKTREVKDGNPVEHVALTCADGRSFIAVPVTCVEFAQPNQSTVPASHR